MGGLPAGTSVGPCPQQVERELDVAREGNRVGGLTLLRKGLVAIGAAAGEADALATTPGHETRVEEFAPIVAVPRAQGDGQALPEDGCRC